MCDKDIAENGGTLTSVSDSYHNKKMCNQDVDSYADVL